MEYEKILKELINLDTRYTKLINSFEQEIKYDKDPKEIEDTLEILNKNLKDLRRIKMFYIDNPPTDETFELKLTKRDVDVLDCFLVEELECIKDDLEYCDEEDKKTNKMKYQDISKLLNKVRLLRF